MLRPRRRRRIDQRRPRVVGRAPARGRARPSPAGASRSTAAARAPTRPSPRRGWARRSRSSARSATTRWATRPSPRSRPRASTSPAWRGVDAPTGVALIVVDAAGENQIAVASGANAALSPAATSLDLLAATGVVLLGHEVSRGGGRRGRRARGRGGRLARRAEPGARARAARRAARGAHAERVRGRRSSPAATTREAAARALVGAHRRGRADHARRATARCCSSRAARRVRLPATQVDVVDTTGAGDTVNGALAAELAAGRPLRATRRGSRSRAAALSTTAAGRARRHADARASRASTA